MKTQKSEWILDRNKFLEKDQIADMDIALNETREAFWHSTELHLREVDPYTHSFKGCQKDTLARDWFLVKLCLNTGLRVEEMKKLRCGDFNLNSESPSVYVRCGKGGKSRRVRFSEKFKRDVLEYYKMKIEIGQSIEPIYKVFFTKHSGGISVRALQHGFKRMAIRAGLNECYSIHCLRHTYASFLYEASNHNLRLVQLQLGHASIQITQVYTHLITSDTEKCFERIYNG